MRSIKNSGNEYYIHFLTATSLQGTLVACQHAAIFVLKVNNTISFFHKVLNRVEDALCVERSEKRMNIFNVIQSHVFSRALTIWKVNLGIFDPANLRSMIFLPALHMLKWA